MDHLAPFSSTFSPNLPELLYKLQISLVISTFQAGKVIFISPKNEEELIQLPRTFKSPMGIALNKEKMAIATKQEVIVFKESKSLANTYPKKPDTYDALFVPRASYFTGRLDLHDLHWGNNKLWAVNTLFSCICNIDGENSFSPVWKPEFISELRGEDRCHLNGLAMKDEKPAYATALGSENGPQSWRNDIFKGGVLMDIQNNGLVVEGLAMPHTPRIINGKLYLLLSAKELLIEVDVNRGKYHEVAHIPGFIRGMAHFGDFLFIATSKLRKNSSTFKNINISKDANYASINILHLPTATIVARLQYHTSVDEIYDVHVLPGILRPNILNTYDEMHLHNVQFQDVAYWQVKEKVTKHG